MSILYLDCGMGAAGDMLSAALYELMPDKEACLERLNQLGIPGVVFCTEKAVRAGITGTHMAVLVHGQEEEDILGGHDHPHVHDHDHPHDHIHDHVHEHPHDHDHEHDHMHAHDHIHHHDHEHTHAHIHDHVHAHDHDHGHGHHHHAGMHEIGHIIEHLDIPENVRKDVMGVYEMIAQAESSVHGVSMQEIHFHEVGSLDAVADITAFCLMINELAPEKVYVSPVRTGSGTVKCAHGVLPVPAPATAHLLKGIPVFAGDIPGEMCTPTGAAILKYFADEFCEMPPMMITKIGYGAGKREFETANVVRALLGDVGSKALTDHILQLSFNVDDMTAEEIGFAMDLLFEAGARDVFTLAAGMKKSRPGTLVNVICSPDDKEKMLEIIFRNTSTIGVREIPMQRYVLDRQEENVDTAYGTVRRKLSAGYGVSKIKYEYEDLIRLAKESGLSLSELKARLEKEQ